jgi:hypothetical protein
MFEQIWINLQNCQSNIHYKNIIGKNDIHLHSLWNMHEKLAFLSVSNVCTNKLYFRTEVLWLASLAQVLWIVGSSDEKPKVVNDCCLAPNRNYISYILAKTSYIWWDGVDDARFMLDQHVEFDILQCYLTETTVHR